MATAGGADGRSSLVPRPGERIERAEPGNRRDPLDDGGEDYLAA